MSDDPGNTAPDRDRAAERLIQETRRTFGRVLQAAVRSGEDTERDPASLSDDRYAFHDTLESLAEFSADILDTAEERIRANLTPDPKMVDPETGHLTVIEPAEIELSVYAAGLCSGVADRHATVLAQLHALVPRLSPIADPHALDPDMLLGAFVARIAHMGLSETSRRIACRLLYEALEPELEGYYRTAVAVLEPLPPSEAPAPLSEDAGPSGAGHEPGSQSAVVIPQELLVNREGSDAPAGTTRAAPPRPLSAFERQTVLEAFTALQQEQSSSTDLLPPAALTRRVGMVLYEQGAFNTTHLTAAITPVAEFVCEVFNRVLSDKALPKEARGPLAALQIPVTKLAYMDLEAFRDPESPARRLLRALTGLALHVTGPDGEHVLEGMQRAVRYINRRFQGDPSVVERALNAVNRLLRETERRAQRREHEARARRLRRARLQAAQKEVLTLFRERLAGRALHRHVATFMEHCWLPCMARVLAIQGRSSGTWRQIECLMEQLLLAGSTTMPLERFDMVVGPLQGLEAELRSHLERCRIGGHEHLERLMRWLRAVRFRATQSAVTVDVPRVPSGPPTETLEVSPEESPSVSTGAPSEKTPPPPSPTSPSAAPLPPEVRPGTWFEIFLGEHRAKRRLKLSAVMTDTGEVLFATRTGEETLTLPLQRFLDDLREGRSSPIEDTNRFEHALQAVIRSRATDDT